MDHHGAKNVILFLGDGMGPVSVTASRFYLAKSRNQNIEDTHFAWDKFPYTGISKPYTTDYMTADSAGSATAYLCGVKTRLKVIGVNEFADYKSCEGVDENSVHSILTLARKQGRSTGLVTNTRITHATPSATYAHVPDRKFEYEIPEYVKYREKCKDIARQFVEDTDFDVVLAGGRRSLKAESDGGKRKDGRDLVKEWVARKKSEGLSEGKQFKYVETTKDLMSLKNMKSLQNILGLFSMDHMAYEYDRVKNELFEQPSLKEMTRFAIENLQQKGKGYVLVVEGGRIDHAHHANNAFRAFNETAMFSDTVAMATEITDRSDTLIVVTADHGHSMFMGSYTRNDADILGFADPVFTPFEDGKPMLAVNYISGQGYYKHRMSNGVEVPRLNLTGVDTTDPEFLQDALVPRKYGGHGGQDVTIYARGPNAYLFTGVHEQQFIYHAMTHASCLGDSGVKGRNLCTSSASRSSGAVTFVALTFALLSVINSLRA